MRVRIIILGLLAVMSLRAVGQNEANAPGAGDPPEHIAVLKEPALISRPALEFPAFALQASVSGILSIKGVINREGIPVKTEILKREPEMAFLFDEAARKFFMNCRFSPAIDSGGNPVAVWVTMPVRFDIKGFSPPALNEFTPPEYPRAALDQGLEGWVGVAVVVEPSGRVRSGNAAVVARYPAGTDVFDQSALVAATASRYVPASNEKGSTTGWCFVKVVFRIPLK
jgi:TonB family protein